MPCQHSSLCFVLQIVELLLIVAAMSNQELINSGTKAMDETDQAIERSKQVDCITLWPFLTNIPVRL